MYRHVPAGLLILGLAACEGAVGGGGGGDGVTPQFADSSADVMTSKMVDGGVSGALAELNVLSNSSRKRAAMLEASEDYQEVFLTIGSTRYQLKATQFQPGSENGGLYLDAVGNTATFLTGSGDYSGVVQFTNGSGAVIALGILGAETPEANLPDATLTYDGLFQFVGAPTQTAAAGANGFAEITVDFVSGGVTGDFREGLTPDGFGVLTGQVAGNGIEGDLVVSNADLSGTLNVDGTFFGPAAEELGGTLTGDVTAGGSNVAVMGQFKTECIALGC
ncbi:transferrin-binding protein-like solute binding protein [Oceanibium sediminis]|uniref:transferrin-binding protein-like solute binding protein n=1 Tax=Oceanibium sediminis TaxID=2026339 RepID=UPI000DD32F5A|nr:transferrin-binding protein-like solute binding protein [Oceanibium sediminis]